MCIGFGQFQPSPGQSPLLGHTGLVPGGSQQFPHQPSMGPQHGAAAQQQQFVLQQQQQQKALQEQMLRAQQEEQKRMEFERKQLQLKNIDVSKASSSAGPSLESLIGFTVPPRSASSSSPKQRPTVNKGVMQQPAAIKADPDCKDKLPYLEWPRKQDQLETNVTAGEYVCLNTS